MISNGLSRGRFVGSTGMVVSICMSSCGRRQKIGLDMFGEFFYSASGNNSPCLFLIL